MVAKRKRLSTDLSKDDWIKAGFKALTKSGPQGVKIDLIAKSLNISRGSFYWHFDSASALKQAMITHWVEVGTNDVIALAEMETESTIAKFAALGRRITGPRDVEYGGILAESAIRDWGRYDKDVGEAVALVTSRRLAYLATLFEDFGLQPTDAKIRANLLVGTMTGLEFLNSLNLATIDAELTLLMQLFMRSTTAETSQKPVKKN